MALFAHLSFCAPDILLIFHNFTKKNETCIVINKGIRLISEGPVFLMVIRVGTSIAKKREDVSMYTCWILGILIL